MQYAEAGLSFLDESHWESEHELSMALYNNSVAALYACTGSDRDLLQQRIDSVFKHALSLEEEFETRCTWIHLLSYTFQAQAAIDECHVVLNRLGEPIESESENPIFVASELKRVQVAFVADENHAFLSKRMNDPNKMKAMKVMSFYRSFTTTNYLSWVESLAQKWLRYQCNLAAVTVSIVNRCFTDCLSLSIVAHM